MLFVWIAGRDKSDTDRRQDAKNTTINLSIASLSLALKEAFEMS